MESIGLVTENKKGGRPEFLALKMPDSPCQLTTKEEAVNVLRLLQTKAIIAHPDPNHPLISQLSYVRIEFYTFEGWCKGKATSPLAEGPRFESSLKKKNRVL